MIFVTVGTHEQQFNRLIKEIDKLKGENLIEDEVFIQIGYSDYEPTNCNYKKMLTFEEMEKYMSNAALVITHGGPASFIKPIQYGKVPIVVPRLLKFDEHVNNHQLDFAQFIKKELNNIMLVEDIDDMLDVINENLSASSNNVRGIESNNVAFNKSLGRIIDDLLK